MKSLYQIYNGIYNCPCMWKYYSSITNDSVFDVSAEFASNFISDFFRAGQKVDMPKVSNLNRLRLTHTLSTYFLGIYLFEQFRFKSTFEKDHYPKDFRYFWFLLCLCHDVGYSKERAILKENDKINQDANRGTIESRLKELFNKYTLPRSITTTVNFSPKLIEKYNEYIQDIFNKREHGTEGALDFFDGVISYHNSLVSVFGHGKSSFQRNGVHISDEFRDRCCEVATIIAIHNIWLDYGYNTGVYKGYQLEELTGGKKFRISEDAVLYWILQLADSLEPLKRCSEEKFHKRILKSIRVLAAREGDNCTIIIKYRSRKLCREFINNWIRGIIGLEDWTEISVNKGSFNKMVISFTINNL